MVMTVGWSRVVITLFLVLACTWVLYVRPWQRDTKTHPDDPGLRVAARFIAGLFMIVLLVSIGITIVWVLAATVLAGPENLRPAPEGDRYNLYLLVVLVGVLCVQVLWRRFRRPQDDTQNENET
jgi:membrane protein implicated in regulation of membrane protease activity